MTRISVGVFLCSLVLLGCGNPELDAHNRVTMMMTGWQSGGTTSGGDIEEAVCRWYNGARQLQLDHLKVARDKFDEWRREKSLYKRIESWTINDVTKESGSDPPAAIVSIDIDGQSYKMRVPKEKPIEWVS